jgi:hypothetical protein
MVNEWPQYAPYLFIIFRHSLGLNQGCSTMTAAAKPSRTVRRLLSGAVLMVISFTAAPTVSHANDYSSPGGGIAGRSLYRVWADYGGSVRTGLRDVQALRASQRRVEIRGSVCMSTCTMLLSLRNTCVTPETVFGFHGPSRGGVPLERLLFDQVSMIIAQHYPEPVRSWYMNVARHSLTDIHALSGAELIKLGAASPCDVAPTYHVAGL